MNVSKILTIVLLISPAVWMISCTEQTGTTTKEVSLENDIDSVSYAIGVDIGNNLKKSGFEEINPNAVAKGFSDVFGDNETMMEAEAANAYIMDYFQKAQKRKGQKNLEESEQFLAENKEKEGVQVTETGLQYKVMEEGSGPVPEETDMVKVYYTGTLIDGTEFDSTEEGNPAQFRVNGVIKGWTEALKMMPVGSKWKLFIPPDLAYGENPRQGGVIKPNDALIFEIELLEIVEK